MSSTRRRQWIMLFAACGVVVGVHAVVIAHRRAHHVGDFDVSREFGRRFLAGEDLYAGGLHYPYMPTAALYFSALALVPPTIGFALRYGVALGCLCLTLHFLRTMVGARGGVASDAPLIVVSTLLLASHYIIRDLDDGGPHLILLAVLVGGIFSAWSGRDALAATCFGLATALKAPAALFLPFVLCKRRWRLAACTALATAAWIALPAVWMGPASWWRHQYEWTRVAFESVAGRPVRGAEESEERVQNQALRPVLTRYLVGAFDEPAFDRGGGRLPMLSHAAANAVATLMALGLVAACAWWARPHSTGAAAAWLLQCSAVLILALLLSPVTWTQHLVLMVPALYLIVAEHRGIRPLGAPALAAMTVYVMLALVLNRELLGRESYVRLLAYGTHTLCMLLVLAVIMLRRPTVET